MVEVPEDLKYTESHEWIRLKGKNAWVGITDYAQEQLNDIVYVELPLIGAVIEKGEEIATVESVKSAAPVISPASGKVADVNRELEDEPELMNKEPYGKGWIAKLEISDEREFEELLSPDDYRKLLK